MSDILATPDRNKEIYTSLDDRILEKRLASPYPIRRHSHAAQWQAFVDHIPPGSTVLDAGCGPGALSVMLAEHGCHVTGTDISEPNVVEAKKYAEKKGCSHRTEFRTADIEHMPFPDKSFDYAVSSHVLEHVPNFAKGASELSRLAKKHVIIAIPTCMTLAGMTLLGGDNYWAFSRHSLYALPYGFLRVVAAFLTGKEGVNEGYEGNMELIHIWRFPWAGKRRIEEGSLKVVRYRASAIVFPYFAFLLPLSRFLEKFAWAPIIKECGCGTTYVCEPVTSK
ncbi:MAG: class I SAM-dependent methyltransferase [Candidatus Peribacteraceae bacterium]|nr:class I SAM-dependent methyltransferase [Candidatus Peribacteraceae bacterium]MBP9850378.1 class I SAM-dependent methyltransferase [Candidatus Peribacteraceae bacterium]